VNLAALTPSAHAAALHAYGALLAWAFRDPETGAREPIYSVRYNRHAANAMGVAYQYDAGWVKEARSEYRRFVHLSDVVELSGTVTQKRIDADGEAVVDIETKAVNQRGENVMPGSATVALPRRDGTAPAARRARPGSSPPIPTP
jgi:hypothetical protein